MNVPKFAAPKRTSSEMQKSSSSGPTYSVAAVSCNSAPTDNSGGEGGASAGGGEGGVGEVDEEEEPSSSSLKGLGWSVKDENNLSRAKRFKHTLATIRENASEEVNTFCSSDEPRLVQTRNNSETTKTEEVKLREYSRVSQKQLDEAQAVASLQGGELISRIIIESGERLAFKCRNKHIFKTTIQAARTEWCQRCNAFYEGCIKLALNNNGKVLDPHPVKPMHFQCAKGHKFTCKSYKS